MPEKLDVFFTPEIDLHSILAYNNDFQKYSLAKCVLPNTSQMGFYIENYGIFWPNTLRYVVSRNLRSNIVSK